MSFVKFLGLIDIIVVILFTLFSFFSNSGQAFMPIMIYLLVKGGFFALLFRDIASIIDVICGLYVGLMVLGFSHYIPNTLVILYLGQKSVFSLI